MRRIAAVTVVLGVLFAACNESQVDPGADVTVSGTVQREDGRAVDGARVALMREPDAADVFFAALSIGLTCLENDLSECGETRLQTTGDDGAFTYELKGRDTQGRFGTASIMELAATLERGDGELAGPGMNTRFQVQAERVHVPMRAWEPTIALDGAGASVRAGWTEPTPDVFPATADLGTLRRWVVFEAAERATVWRSDAPAGGVDLDARILEDTRGGFAVFSTIEDIQAPAESGTDVEVLVRSARHPYASPAGAPPSRGASCSAPGVDGTAVVQTPCRLTDGRFDDGFRPIVCGPDDEACTEPHHTQAVVDLGEAIDVTFVVVRGCAGTCTVEASEDAASWRPVGSGADDGGSRHHAFPTAGRARYVRVTAELGTDDLREVSVWDARPVTASGSLLVPVDEVSRELLPDRDVADDGGGSRWLLLLALAAAALAVVAVLLVRRRRAAA